MFQRLDHCPICQSAEFDNHIICRDHLVTQESFAISACKKCQILFTNPRPDDRSLPRYYQSEAYISHQNKAVDLIGWLYKGVRHYTTAQKENICKKVAPHRSILDVGCGTGHFLAACQKNNWEINGVEPNADANQSASLRLKMNVKSSIFDLPPGSDFGIISLWHVLEHIPNINETIVQAKKLLHKKGRIIMALPNYHSFDARHYAENWAAYDVPRHLYHFSPDSIKHFFKLHGLKLKKTLPMKFDAFYVSMLSERYASGKNNYLKAFRIARKSNAMATQDHNYSSLIYIAGK
jgi:2-polyprenyl-3-methyl-5-hydroxy-6-metoxy-1,4-benzoquinol methylase